MIMDSLPHGFELGYLMIQQFAVYLTNFFRETYVH